MLIQGRVNRMLAGGLVAALVATGCATAPSRPAGPALVADNSRESQCRQTATDTAGPQSWGMAARSGLLGLFAGAFQGAAEAFKLATVRGASGRQTWVGAAVGGGAGLVVGLVSGAKQIFEAQAAYQASFQTCMVEAPPSSTVDLVAETEEALKPERQRSP